MIHLLLAVIYLSFISLGLPDSLLGSAWPSMYGQFGVPISYAGIISMIIALGTIVSSLQSDRLTRKLGAGKVTAISVGMTAAALFGFSVSGSFWALCLWAIPYGLGAGSVDAALNNYVALHYASRHMSWLHCMWGVGASVGPYMMGFALSRGNGWHIGYRYIAMLQRQADHQNRRQRDLEHCDVPVAYMPPAPAGQGKAHDVRPHGRAYAPHTVEPAHVAAGVVQRHVVVEGGVHTPGAQAVWNGPQAQRPKAAADGKTEQGCGGHAHADGGNLTCPQLSSEPVALQAGNDGSQGDDHGDDPGVGNRHAKLPIHGRPCGAEERIRQSETDKRKINDG